MILPMLNDTVPIHPAVRRIRKALKSLNCSSKHPLPKLPEEVLGLVKGWDGFLQILRFLEALVKTAYVFCDDFVKSRYTRVYCQKFILFLTIKYIIL